MVAVIGFLLAAGTSIVVVWLAAGRGYEVVRDPGAKLNEVSGRHITIVSGLAGFAVTGIVLLVTLGTDVSDPTSTSFTTLLTMFFVAYVGYFATSSLFANIPEPKPTDGFDVTGAAFAGAAITLYFTIVIGWLALVPMFETFGLVVMADLAGWLLVAAIAGGYAMVAQQLHRSGFASARLVVVIPLVAAAATFAYGIAVGWSGQRSPEATLQLTVTGLLLGSIGFAMLAAMPILARETRLAPVLAARGQYLVLAYIEGTIVLVGFMLLSVLGFA
jgi:hypothetical protein